MESRLDVGIGDTSQAGFWVEFYKHYTLLLSRFVGYESNRMLYYGDFIATVTS